MSEEGTDKFLKGASSKLLNNRRFDRLQVDRLQAQAILANKIIQKKNDKSYLFSLVNNDYGITVSDNNKITLSSGSGLDILKFTDRPFRLENNITLGEFVSYFTMSGVNSFESDPPNASVVYTTDDSTDSTYSSTDYKQAVFEFVYIGDNEFKLNPLNPLNDITGLNKDDKIISIFVDASSPLLSVLLRDSRDSATQNQDLMTRYSSVRFVNVGGGEAPIQIGGNTNVKSINMLSKYPHDLAFSRASMRSCLYEVGSGKYFLKLQINMMTGTPIYLVTEGMNYPTPQNNIPYINSTDVIQEIDFSPLPGDTGSDGWSGKIKYVTDGPHQLTPSSGPWLLQLFTTSS